MLGLACDNGLLLLPYPPYVEKTSKPEKSHVVDMANALVEFVKEICEAETPYHSQLRLIEDAAILMLPFYKADIACLLGELRGDLDLVKMLCIDIAKVLFGQAGLPRDDKTVDMAREVIRSWIKRENEWVQGEGRSLVQTSLGRDKLWKDALMGMDGNLLNV
jgi:hypothetical protein